MRRGSNNLFVAVAACLTAVAACSDGTAPDTSPSSIALSPAERQVLMETPSLRELEDVLLHLMTGPSGQPGFRLQFSTPS